MADQEVAQMAKTGQEVVDIHVEEDKDNSNTTKTVLRNKDNKDNQKVKENHKEIKIEDHAIRDQETFNTKEITVTVDNANKGKTLT